MTRRRFDRIGNAIRFACALAMLVVILSPEFDYWRLVVGALAAVLVFATVAQYVLLRVIDDAIGGQNG
jgi:cobalamin synthase